jgi:two-component system response regulator NreC
MTSRTVAPRPASPRDGGPIGVFLAIVDFPALVAGYRAVLDATADVHVVGTLEGTDGVPEQVARSCADVVITECQPYATDGCVSFASIEAIRAAKPEAGILAVECRCGSEQFSLVIKAGADGFLTREAHPADVVDAVRRIARGERYLSPALVTRMVNTYVLRSPDGGAAEAGREDVFDRLSDRSHEIFRLAAFGRTNREIAETLHISEQTVHNHRAAIMEKLGFHDRMDLLKYALRHGVIEVAEL